MVDPEKLSQETDWQWTPLSTRMPYDGQPVLLKMVERSEHQDVHYGIGWYDSENRKWVMTASPNNVDESLLQRIAWVAVPK
jgi:hypothetical protein